MEMNFIKIIFATLLVLLTACSSRQYSMEECTMHVCHEYKIDNDTIHEHDSMRIERVKIIKK
jgi:hypothetical protein